MKRVLALQQYWDDPPGYLGEIMEEHGIEYDTVKVDDDGVTLPDLAKYGAIFVLGGPQHVYDDHEYLAQEKEFLRAVVEQDIPYLGICLGGQLLASALEATVTRHHMTEIGFHKVQLTDEGKRDPLFHGLPGYEQVIHWHEDVFDMPGGAIRLASSENVSNQAFRIGRRAYGLQYHIEVTADMFDIWFRHPSHQEEIVKLFGPGGPALLEQDWRSLYPIYHAHTRIVFENFLKISECL